MSALAQDFDLAQAAMVPPAQPRRGDARDVAELANSWDAVHQAAEAVGALAQLGQEARDPQAMALPARAAELGGRHYDAVARGIEDLSAVMQPGLRALLALTAQGRDTTPAALTLWREFHLARAAILGLVPAIDD